jgi:hypothetical protein
LVKFSDLVIDELVHAKEHVPLPVELENLQPIEFEPISNHLRPNNIKTTNMPIHHYHNLLVHGNTVVVSIDQNNLLGKAFINVYLLRISNPKSCVNSPPQSHFYMKQYKEPSRFFFFSFSFSSSY